MGLETKSCKCCRRELPLSEFCRRSSAKDGRQSYCKECANRVSRMRYRAVVLLGGSQLHKIRERSREYYKNNKEKYQAKMNVRYKTEHGHAILSVPNSFPVNADAFRAAAAALDRMACETDAGTASLSWRDSEGKTIGSLKWTPDEYLDKETEP